MLHVYSTVDSLFYTCTVNQLLFATTLFHDLPEINRILTTNFCDKNEDCPKNTIPKTFEDWFAARNIRGDVALANLAKISRTKIKAGLQYFILC